MKLSAELTLYPLRDQYLNAIERTISKLNDFDGISVQTFPTASILVGEYGPVMQAVSDTIRWSYDNFGQCVFVAKFLPGYDAHAD